MRASDMLPVGFAQYGYSVTVKYDMNSFCTVNGELSKSEAIALIRDTCRVAIIMPELHDSPGARRFECVCDEFGPFFLAIDIQR